MARQQLRVDLYDDLAKVGKAVANAKRLELIELLAQGPRGVVELSEEASLGLSTTSAHLQLLKSSGLVRAQRSGTTIRYRLAGPEVAALYSLLLDVAEAHSAAVAKSVDRYVEADRVEHIDRHELLRRAKAGEVVVLDVRPSAEYRAGHIPGAISIPLAELDQRLNELPPELEVVAYCRGAYCSFSHDAVRFLVARGRHAVCLDEGIIEWQAAGKKLAAGRA